MSHYRIRKKSDKRDNCDDALDRMAERHPIVKRVGVHHIKASHDEWCDFLNHRGPCNCDPIVEYIATEGQN